MKEDKSLFLLGAILIVMVIFVVIVVFRPKTPEENVKNTIETNTNNGEIISATLFNFEDEVLKSEEALVLFTRDTDPHRETMRSYLKEFWEENPQFKLAEIDTEKANVGDIPMKYGVMLVPSIVYFKNGQYKNSYQGGGITQEDIVTMINESNE